MYNRPEMKAELARHDITIKELAERLKINVKTAGTKISSGNFTLNELTGIKKILNLSHDRFDEIFFADNV